MLAKAQSHGEFLIAQISMIRRKIVGKIAFVVGRTPADSTFEQPFADAIFPATTHLADIAQQW